jgi:transcriptional regulator with XRE-family HTH domain
MRAKLQETPYGDKPFSRARRLWSDRTLRVLTRELLVARLHAGLTQEQVANKLGTRKSAISRLENGLTRPTLTTIENYAQVVGCTIELRLLPRRSCGRPLRR